MINWPSRDTGPAPQNAAFASSTSRQGAGPSGRHERVPMRLLGSVRGAGVLVSDGGETTVTYELDVFHDRMGQTGSGSIEGQVPGDDFPAKARLRLSNGVEVPVSLLEGDEEGAVFETRGGFTLEELTAGDQARKRSRS